MLVQCLSREGRSKLELLPLDALDEDEKESLRDLQRRLAPLPRDIPPPAYTQQPPVTDRIDANDRVDASNETVLEDDSDHVVPPARRQRDQVTPARRQRDHVPPATPTGTGKKPGRPKTLAAVAWSSDLPPTSSKWGPILRKVDFQLPPCSQKTLGSAARIDLAKYLHLEAALGPIPTATEVPYICRRIAEMTAKAARLLHFLIMGQVFEKLWGTVWKRSSEGKSVMMTRLRNKHGKEYFASIKDALDLVRGLTFVCGKLGDGCIFWLVNDLTDAFFKRLVTRSGDAYDEAMRHLETCQLIPKIEESGANELGSRMTEHLSRFYRCEEIKSDDVGQEDQMDVDGDECG